MNESRRDRFVGWEGAVQITNADLVCRDCKHRYDDTEIFGNVDRCEIYDGKPSSARLRKSCDYYEKE